MTDRDAPVPDFNLELWAEFTYPDHGKFRVRAARLARELIAMRKAVRALVAEGDILAEQVNAMLEDTRGRAWLDANPLAWVALAAKARHLLPENKEPTA